MIVVRFRHDSTTSEWQVDGTDEHALRGMLAELAPYSTEPASPEAALTAEADGTTLGTWNRGGAAHLASIAFRDRTTSPWSDMEAAIQGEVMDPHPDQASA